MMDGFLFLFLFGRVIGYVNSSSSKAGTEKLAIGAALQV